MCVFVCARARACVRACVRASAGAVGAYSVAGQWTPDEATLHQSTPQRSRRMSLNPSSQVFTFQRHSISKPQSKSNLTSSIGSVFRKLD